MGGTTRPLIRFAHTGSENLCEPVPPCRGLSILSTVTPSTREPDTGDLPVRFGGRGGPNQGEIITPIPRNDSYLNDHDEKYSRAYKFN